MPQPLKHIAVNTRLLLPGGIEGIGRYSEEILKRMIAAHPETTFSFFFDREYDERYMYGPNVKPYVLFPPARHPFLFMAFFDWAVPRMLRKLKPDVFLSMDGYLSLRTKTPQVAVFHDLAFEHFPEDVKNIEAWHYRRYFPRYAKKAAQLVAVSEYTKGDIQRLYKVPEDKINVVYNAAAAHFFPVSEEVKAKTRAQFSGGKPFLHCVSAIQPRKNLANLIAAFDRFKAEHQSEHQLLIVGRKAWNFDKVIHTYSQSPNKADILFTGFVSDEDLNCINCASDGLCYVPYFEGFGLPILEAMQCETPIVTSKVSSMPEVAGDAALLVDPNDIEEIAQAMLRLVREPGLADELVHRGNLRKAHFSWDSSAEQIWKVLSNV